MGGMSFRRTIFGDSEILWDSLKRRCEEIIVYGGRDKPMWMLTTNRKFSVKSLYLHLIKSDVGFPHKFMWKVKVPAKIKFFLWLLNKKSIITRDNLLKKRGWKGDKHCVLCGKEESIDHLFFSCSIARLIRSLVGCAFDLKKFPKDMDNCFGNWLKNFSKNDKKIVLIGTSALIWDILNSCNVCAEEGLSDFCTLGRDNV